MERNKSFSIKATRFLVPSLTISSSIIFFSIWLFNQPLHTINSSFGAQPPVLTATHFLEPQSQGGIACNSSFEEILTKKNGTEVNEVTVDEKVGEDSHVIPRKENLIPVKKKPENASRLIAVERLHSSSNDSDEVSDTAYVADSLSNNLRPSQQNGSATSFDKSDILNIGGSSSSGICDFTKGRWVYDTRLPLYTNESCPFIDEGFNCEGNGRSDKDYMKWRWELQDCEIARFNATKMLEMIRGKRLVFVGDSINRNQWESMLCLLMGAIKDPTRVYETRRRRITKEKGDYSFKFVDYKCTVEYYVTHFLVHESKAKVGRKRVKTLRIDTMDRGSSRWKGADILVFNTAHWWTHSKTKAGVNYYQEGNQVHPHLDASTAFRRALTTWASWVDGHINPHKTHVFFRSSSPSHFSGGQWNSGGHCKEATQPLGIISTTNYPEKDVIIGEILRGMKTPITILNITRMSEYRIDGHPSSHGMKKRPSSNIQDCSHWCLPGVPDNWNELLYYNLYLKTRQIL